MPPHRPDRRGKPWPSPCRHTTGPAEQPRHHSHLQQACHQQRGGERHRLFNSEPPARHRDQQGAADKQDVENDRHRSRRHEASVRIRDGRPESDKRNHGQIGKGHACQCDRGIHAIRRVGKAGCQQADDGRHEDLAENDKSDKDHRQRRLCLAGEGHGRRLAILPPRPCKGRHEGVGQGPFGGQPPEHVRQFQGDKEGIGRRPGTEQRRKHDITDKSQHTADGRHPPDLAEGPCQRLGAHSAASPTWSNTSSNRSRIVVRRASL